jgi:nuclear transport factor 2 (NTF2) superfamily protein
VKREELAHLEAMVREANPVPRPEDLAEAHDSRAVALLVDRGRRTMTTTPTPTQETPTPTPTAKPPRRRWAWAFAAAFVVVLAGIGVAAFLLQDDDTAQPATPAEQLATAQELAVAWIDAWEANDPDAVAALFTEEATYTTRDGVASGRDAILIHTAGEAYAVSYADLVGSVIATDAGTYRFLQRYSVAGAPGLGEIEMRLDGPLIAEMTWLSYEQEIDVATSIVDAWIAGWNGQDADAMAALFTEDGTYVYGDEVVVGRDDIRAYAEDNFSLVSDSKAYGRGAAMGDSVYVFPAGANLAGSPYVGELEIHLDGAVVSWLSFRNIEDEHQVAVRLLEAWRDGWTRGDPAAVAAQFTLTGQYRDPVDGSVSTSRRAIRQHADQAAVDVTAVRAVYPRHGGARGDGIYTVDSVEIDIGDTTYVGDIRFELHHKLIASMEWTSFEVLEP